MNPSSQLPLNLISSSASPELTILERLDRVVNAWTLFGRNQRFANRTLSQLVAQTNPSREIRATLAGYQAIIQGGISARNNADKALGELTFRVISAIRAHRLFGPESGLHRALGYTPKSERKPPRPPVPGEKRPKSPKIAAFDRYNTVLMAWTEMAPEASFAEMSLADFKQASADSLRARAEIESARTAYKGGIALRAAADAVTLKLIGRVVSSIKAEENFGNDCEMYRAMGYIPASERKVPRRPRACMPVRAEPLLSDAGPSEAGRWGEGTKPGEFPDSSRGVSLISCLLYTSPSPRD